ncbi:MAG: response regulator [Desulfobacterales bacterium]|nr:response regulator [Desulfobacterales bacterium]
MATKNSHKILVVDDEQSIREAIYTLLTMEGYSVATAEDGIVALKKLQNNSYDLLITDLVMPNMGGAELLDWVYQSNLKMTALVITGSPISNMEEYLKDKGAFACIPKPFQLKHLSFMVQKGLKIKSGRTPSKGINSLKS